MTRKFTVKNPFYLNGIVQAAGSEIELDEHLVDELAPKDVLGREIGIELKPPEKPSGEGQPFTLDEFSALSAADQKAELSRLEIGAEASNKEDRIAVYAAYLAGEPNVEDQTGGAAGVGAGGTEDNQITT